MKIEQKLMAGADKLLSQIDNVGFQPDAIGVENQVNRHSLIAMAMFGQKRLEGEVDSLTARVETQVAKVESIASLFQQYLKSGYEVATFPVSYAVSSVKGIKQA